MAIMAIISIILLYFINVLGVPQYKTFSLAIATIVSCIPIYYLNFIFDVKMYVLEMEKNQLKPNYFIIIFEVFCILLMIPMVIGF